MAYRFTFGTDKEEDASTENTYRCKKHKQEIVSRWFAENKRHYVLKELFQSR